MDTWDISRKSEELIFGIRKIILATPESEWTV